MDWSVQGRCPCPIIYTQLENVCVCHRHTHCYFDTIVHRCSLMKIMKIFSLFTRVPQSGCQFAGEACTATLCVLFIIHDGVLHWYWVLRECLCATFNAGERDLVLAKAWLCWGFRFSSCYARTRFVKRASTNACCFNSHGWGGVKMVHNVIVHGSA